MSNLISEQVEVQGRIANAILDGKKVLLVSDFDGTLSPFTDNPQHAGFDPEAEKGFSALVAHPNIEGIILTGREVDFMRGITHDKFDVVGSHGVEFYETDGTYTLHQFSDAEQNLIDDTKQQIIVLQAVFGDELTIEVDKHGALSVKTSNKEALAAAGEIIQAAIDSPHNNAGTFVSARESDHEIELRPNEERFGKAYGLENFIVPADDSLVVFLCDSLKGNKGTDVSAAKAVRARGENGIVLRVENGRFDASEILDDSCPHATYESPAALGVALQAINGSILSMGLDSQPIFS